MPTRAELRSMVRLRLEDTSPTPLWDDATLNDALGAAMHTYSARVPIEKALSVAIAAGAVSVPLVVAGSPLEARQVVAVLDDAGVAIPRTRGAGGDATGPVSWRVFAGTLVLSRPLSSAATWTVRYLAPRTLPTDDVTAVELVPGDAPIVASLAAATLLRRRAIEDAKRGLPAASLTVLADRFESQANAELAARKRRLIGSWADVA